MSIRSKKLTIALLVPPLVGTVLMLIETGIYNLFSDTFVSNIPHETTKGFFGIVFGIPLVALTLFLFGVIMCAIPSLLSLLIFSLTAKFIKSKTSFIILGCVLGITSGFLAPLFFLADSFSAWKMASPSSLSIWLSSGVAAGGISAYFLYPLFFPQNLK